MPTQAGPQAELDLGKAVFADLVGRAFGSAGPVPKDGPGVVESCAARGVEQEAIPRLFAMGYYDRVDELPADSRKAFHATMAPVIRWVESQVPHSLWPEVEARAQQPELDWMREVAALDLARQGDPWDSSGMRAPWLLSALEPQTPTPSLGEGPGPEITSRLRRVLLTPGHRFAVVRRMAAETRDIRLLHALCSDPAFFESDHLCLALLLVGDSAQISCALHALRLRPEHEETVADALLTSLGSRPFAEVADRVVELHAQASMAPGVRSILIGALLDLAVDAADSGQLGPEGEVLLGAVRRDARFFRHCFLPIEVAEALQGRAPALAAALRSDVFEGFAGTFTPAGVAHPLNDQPFALKIGELLSARADERLATVGDILAVGRRLGDLAEHLSIGSSAGLASRFHATFARALLGGARHAWAQREASDSALHLYGALAHLATGPARHLLGQGFFGALDARIEAIGDGPIPREVLIEAARMEAGGSLRRAVLHQTGANLRAVPGPLRVVSDEPDLLVPSPAPPSPAATTSSSPMLLEDPYAVVAALGEIVTPRPLPDPLAATDSSNSQADDDEGAFKVPALHARGGATPFAVMLRLLGGVELVRRVAAPILGVLGYRRTGALKHEEGELRFAESVHMAGRTLRESSEAIPVTDLTAVRSAPSPATVYRIFGVGLLLTCASLGMMVFFEGLRASRFDLALCGVGLGVLGMLLDGACHRAWSVARDQSVVTIERSGPAPTITWRLDGAHAEALLRRLDAAEVQGG